MFDDLIPIKFDLPYGKDIKVHPIADLHYGSTEFREDEWNKFVAGLGDDDYIVCVGDLMDNATKSSVSNCYRATCSPREQKKWLVEQLTPLRNRIICGCGGNHERRSSRDVDDDPLYDVFAKLDIEDRYRECMAFVFLRFGHDRYTEVAKRPTYVMCVTHGAGGGMYVGSSGAKSERFANQIDGLDILVTGHTHKPFNFPGAKLVVDTHNCQIKQRQFKCVTATSWLDYGGYPLEKMLSPVAFSRNEIWLNAKEKCAKVLQC